MSPATLESLTLNLFVSFFVTEGRESAFAMREAEDMKKVAGRITRVCSNASPVCSVTRKL